VGRTADRIYIGAKKSRTITASTGGWGAATGLYLLPVAYKLSGFGGYKEGVGTIRASGGNNGGGSETIIVWDGVRKLTPRECERLQGFPDDWTKYDASGGEIADTRRYSMIGNAIHVPCAKRVVGGIRASMEGMNEYA
jgi:DNA (cytosine-5)-methyltransferase 1